MTKIRRISRSDGFTILEVMVGMMIFSIGLLTLLSMIVVSIDGNSWSKSTTQAVQLVRQTVEEIKNTRLDDLETTGYDETNGILRHWYIEDVEDIDRLKQVTVWIFWYDNLGRPQYTSTKTFFQPKE